MVLVLVFVFVFVFVFVLVLFPALKNKACQCETLLERRGISVGVRVTSSAEIAEKRTPTPTEMPLLSSSISS